MPRVRCATRCSRSGGVALRTSVWNIAAAAATVAVLATQTAQAQGAPPDDRPLITGFELRGVTSVDRDELAAGLATRGSQCRSLLYAPICWFSRSPLFVDRRYLDPEELRRDLLRVRLFYWRRGWRDALATADIERTDAGVRVIIAVDEGRPTLLERLDVRQVDSVLPSRAIAQTLLLEPGDPIDFIALDSTVKLLRDALWERGYAEAEVTLDTNQVSDALNRGPVTITIRPGPRTYVRAIEIVGNEKVDDETIGRLLTFEPGDLYRRSAILESQRNLYLSGLFQEVDVVVPPGDPEKIVQLRVVEADLNRIEVAGGITTADFVQLESQYIRFNFLGSARRLTLTATFSNLFADALNGEGFFYDVTNGAGGPMRDLFLRPTWSVSADFVQPWFFSPNNQIGTTIFAHRRAVPGIMIDRGFGATGAFTHNFGMRSNTTLGYTFELSEIDASDVYFCVNFGVCVTETIDILGGRHQLAPLSSVTQIDVANDPFTPDRGYRVRIDAEHASSITFSDFGYNRIEVNGSAYFGLTRRSTLATHLRLGWVDPIGGTTSALGLGRTVEERVVHPRKRFYAGGSQSVRGFGERQLGPRVLTISPDALTDSALMAPCTTADLRDGNCNPNIPGLPSDAFQPQPLGGTVLAEASVEWRFPLLPARGLTGAVFIDGALIGANQLTDLLGATGAITPGFGVRLETPVGPVRLDLGVRPTLVERLPVITQVEGPDGEPRLVTLNSRRRFDPLDNTGSFLRRVLSRLRLHLAIGEAF